MYNPAPSTSRKCLGGMRQEDVEGEHKWNMNSITEGDEIKCSRVKKIKRQENRLTQAGNLNM